MFNQLDPQWSKPVGIMPVDRPSTDLWSYVKKMEDNLCAMPSCSSSMPILCTLRDPGQPQADRGRETPTPIRNLYIEVDRWKKEADRICAGDATS